MTQGREAGLLDAASAPPPATMKSDFDPMATPPKHTVLIAEDNAQLRRLFTTVLTAAGYVVVAVSHGGEVLPSIQEHQPDTLLLDLGLPGIDGFTILQEVRSGVGSSLHVVLTTGRLLEDHDPALQMADGYLLKPIGLKDLVESVRPSPQ